jgi:hypothetical protein
MSAALLAGAAVVALLGRDAPGEPAAVGQTTQPGEPVAAARDTDPPRLVVPAAAVTSEATGPDGARVSYAARARDDADGALEARCSPSSGEVFALGATTVECSARDEAGNDSTASFEVVVRDTTGPEVAVPERVELEAGTELAYEVSAQDIVGGETATECTVAPGAVLAAGSTEVTCTAEDASGNVGTASFEVAVGEAEAPLLALPRGRIVEATGPNGARVRFQASARHDGKDVATRCSRRSAARFPLGVSTVRCTARGAGAVQATGTFVVRVVDTTPPALRVPTTRTIEATGPGGARVTFVATAGDLVDGRVAPRCTPRSGTRFPLGRTTVRCTATDTRRNRATATFAVVVRDTTAPTLTLPAPQTAEATGPGGAPVAFAATARDRVAGVLEVSCSRASGSTFPLGTTAVRCTAGDGRGNRSGGTFDVTVADTTAPELALPPNRTVQATSDAGARVTFSASARDVVDGNVAATCTPSSGSTFAVGTTTVSCSARDARGNARSGSFTVTVTPLPRPDLVVTVTPTSFTVSNAGNAAAGAFTVTVQGVGTYTFAGLAAGASATRTVSCASIQRLVRVDPANAVTESNESNNTARIPPC